jgi:hypothetical protein
MMIEAGSRDSIGQEVDNFVAGLIRNCKNVPSGVAQSRGDHRFVIRNVVDGSTQKVVKSP